MSSEKKDKGINGEGLLYIWQKITNLFVKKEQGKGLSSNDYTTDDKVKLGGIDTGANKTVISDSLSTDSATEALSARQGKVLDEKIKAINTNMGNLGGGDMMKSAYDTDNNGKVDNADNADKFGGETPSAFVKQVELADVAKSGSYNDLKDKPTDFAPSLHTHEQKDINGLDDTISTITNIANGKCKSYTFETTEELDTALAEYVAFITNGTEMSDTNPIKGQTLGNGDVFLIRVVDVPDYWWDASTNSKQILETAKVTIAFLSNDEIDAILADA